MTLTLAAFLEVVEWHFAQTELRGDCFVGTGMTVPLFSRLPPSPLTDERPPGLGGPARVAQTLPLSALTSLQAPTGHSSLFPSPVTSPGPCGLIQEPDKS